MQPGKQLTMLMEMKAPGAGVLEFDVDGNGRGTITVTAYFHPAGVWGILYWFAVLPLHAFLFRGMTREIARRASQESPVA